MVWFKKVLLFAYVGLIIVHIIRFCFYDESLTSFVLGCIGMILIILSIVIPQKKTMKQFLKIIIPIFILAAIAFMSYKVISKINHKNEVAEHIKTIPTFSYKTIEGKPFSNQNLKDNTPTVFLYFNSECEHCQSQAERIRDNLKKFTNAQLVFISFEEPKKIKAFATKYKLLGYDNISFLSDSKVSFATTFDVNSLPTIVIYDKNKKLVAKIKGEIKVEAILKKLN